MDAPELEHKTPTFKQELTWLINRHGLDSLTNTPDFILADYFETSFRAYKEACDSVSVRTQNGNKLKESKDE